MDANEREQYEAAIHGDREAFEMIIRTHSRTLFAIAYGILQSREEAEDVVQDSLVKAWEIALARARPGKISRVVDDDRATQGTRHFSQTPHSSAFQGRNRTDRNPISRHNCYRSAITFSARGVAGASSHRADPALLRRNGLSHHRKYVGSHEWRASRNSWACSSVHAQTASPGSRFNALDVWQPFTTNSTAGSLPICTASFLTANGAPFTRTSSNAPFADELTRKPRL